VTASSGIGADGTWTPAFAGQREPFKPGHQLSVRHGAHSVVRLHDRADELAAGLWELLPSKNPAFGPAVAVAAIAGARVEAAAAALADVDDPLELPSLDARLRTWTAQFLRAMDALGMTPKSFGELRLHVAVGDNAQARLQEYLRKNYGDRSEESS
jgi:hypothetical protein